MKHILNFNQFVNESMLNEASAGEFEALMKPYSKLKLTPSSTKTDEFKEALAKQLGVKDVSELTFITAIKNYEDDTPEETVAMFLDGVDEESTPIAVWYDEGDEPLFMKRSHVKDWYTRNYYKCLKIFKDLGLTYAITYTEKNIIIIFPTDKKSEMVKVMQYY